MGGAVMGGAVMGWFWIWPVLVVIGLALLGYLAYRLTQNRGGPGVSVSAPDSAPEILDRRYARGEIDEAEYRKQRETLK